MTYANVIFSYGTERFCKTASEIGMDGIILPDVPWEEKEEFASVCKQFGLDFISLIAPTSQSRISKIAAEAHGFIYCVSSLGVTGVRSAITSDIGSMVNVAKQSSPLPVAVGFGISTPEQAAQMAMHADGVIIGSAIVSLIAQYGKQAVEHVYAYAKSIKSAIAEVSVPESICPMNSPSKRNKIGGRKSGRLFCLISCNWHPTGIQGKDCISFLF